MGADSPPSVLSQPKSSCAVEAGEDSGVVPKLLSQLKSSEEGCSGVDSTFASASDADEVVKVLILHQVR